MKAKFDLEQALKSLARRSITEFSTYTDKRYRMNWHHALLCDYLDKFVRKEIKRLMVFMPPRHGKSELVSRKLPAFIFGRDPDVNIIATSYSGDLASRMNRDVQRIMDSEEYRSVFPETTLSRTVGGPMVKAGTYLRNSNMFEVVGHRGTYRSAGVGGGITGMGADYIIIDDPIKNREEANSQAYREKLWDWYTSTLYTRQEKDGCILVTLTRWHEDDLAGRLLETAKQEDGDQWEVLSLPAIKEDDDCPYDKREEGESLWADKYDTRALATIKTTLGSYEWTALYQQHPSPARGSIFLRDWWQYWLELPSLHHFDNIIQSWDCTFKDHAETDYVVGQVWASKGADRYLLDQVRDRMDFPSTIKAVQKMKSKWPATSAILIEDKANGPAVISTLKHDVSGLIAVNPEGGKVVRAQAVTAQIEAGNVYIPSPEKCAWVGDFIEECAAFPNGRNDDQVDAMTQALTRLHEEPFVPWTSSPDWL